MTGFGRAKKNIEDFDITVEIKSVNHKYFEFSSRVPRMYQFLDEKLNAFCRERIARGKVEVSVMVEDRSENSIELEVNKLYADAYIKALGELAEEYGLKNDVSVSSLIGNSDIFTTRRLEADEELISKAVLEVANEAIDNFIAMRTFEGERLKKDVNNRILLILNDLEFIEQRSPQTVSEYRERLEQKIRDLLGDVQVDEQRLLTETAIFADKIAVAEETVRLRSHIKQFTSMLENCGSIGRKLDFTVQEMNRETNTIGSKSQDLEINQRVVNIKAEIEKIREQIQNIE